MKEHFNYCRQLKAYADSVGYCLVELEGNETVEDVKKEYTSGEGWWAKKYSHHRAVESYTYRDKAYEGRLILISTRSAYTG